MSSGEVNWRLEETPRLGPRRNLMAELQAKGVKGQQSSAWKPSDRDLSSETSWRSSDEERKSTIRKNMDSKMINTVKERLIKAAKENEQRELKSLDDAKCPVKLGIVKLYVFVTFTYMDRIRVRSWQNSGYHGGQRRPNSSHLGRDS